MLWILQIRFDNFFYIFIQICDNFFLNFEQYKMHCSHMKYNNVYAWIIQTNGTNESNWTFTMTFKSIVKIVKKFEI